MFWHEILFVTFSKLLEYTLSWETLIPCRSFTFSSHSWPLTRLVANMWRREWDVLPTMLKRLAVEIFLTVVLPSSSPSSIGSSPSLIRPTWNSEVFETCRRMFIRILCFTPWEKSWWIPSFCFTFNWSPAFVARTSSVQRFFLCWIAIFLLQFTQDLIYGLPCGIQQNDSLLQLLLWGIF